MTDEEKAEEYINKNPSAKILCPFEEGRIRRVKDAILYGLAEGRKEKWHDLRKNPDDLPKESGDYWVKCSNGSYCISTYIVGSKHRMTVWRCLTAWCELPKFEGRYE